MLRQFGRLNDEHLCCDVCAPWPPAGAPLCLAHGQPFCRHSLSRSIIAGGDGHRVQGSSVAPGRPLGGQHPPKRVVRLLRNEWSAWTETAGQIRAQYGGCEALPHTGHQLAKPHLYPRRSWRRPHVGITSRYRSRSRSYRTPRCECDHLMTVPSGDLALDRGPLICWPSAVPAAPRRCRDRPRCP
jgi:hypothetical protein